MTPPPTRFPQIKNPVGSDFREKSLGIGAGLRPGWVELDYLNVVLQNLKPFLLGWDQISLTPTEFYDAMLEQFADACGEIELSLLKRPVGREPTSVNRQFIDIQEDPLGSPQSRFRLCPVKRMRCLP